MFTIECILVLVWILVLRVAASCAMRCEMDAAWPAGVSEDNEKVMGTGERGEG